MLHLEGGPLPLRVEVVALDQLPPEHLAAVPHGPEGVLSGKRYKVVQTIGEVDVTSH